MAPTHRSGLDRPRSSTKRLRCSAMLRWRTPKCSQAMKPTQPLASISCTGKGATVVMVTWIKRHYPRHTIYVTRFMLARFMLDLS